MADSPTPVMAIDPSSNRTGYAVGTANGRRLDLVDFGYWSASSKIPPVDRALSFGEQMYLMGVEHDIQHIIIETPSGHSHGGKLRRGLATYGMAVGTIIANAVNFLGRDGITLVNVNEWTRGVPKPDRAMLVDAAFDAYDSTNDKGFDAADAIGLLWWWCERRTEGDV